MAEDRSILVARPGYAWEKKWDFIDSDLSGSENKLKWARSMAIYDHPYYIFGTFNEDSSFSSSAGYVNPTDMTDDTPEVLDYYQENARGVAMWPLTKYIYSAGWSGSLEAFEWEPGSSLVHLGAIATVSGQTDINPSMDLTCESESRLWHQGWDNNTGQHIVASIDLIFDSDGEPIDADMQEEFYPDTPDGHPLGISYNQNDDTLYLPEGGTSEVDEDGFAENPKDILVYDLAGTILASIDGPPVERVYGLHYDQSENLLWAVCSYVKGSVALRATDLRLIQRDDHGRRINDTTSTSRQHNKERITAPGTYW